MKLINWLIIFINMLIYLSCSLAKQEHESFDVCYYKEQPFGLHYNYIDAPLSYRGKVYSIVRKEHYTNCKIQKVDVYKSEGFITYTYQDLMADKILAEYFDISLNRTIKVFNNKLYDNGTPFSFEKKGDSLFVNGVKEIIVYTTNQ